MPSTNTPSSIALAGLAVLGLGALSCKAELVREGGEGSAPSGVPGTAGRMPGGSGGPGFTLPPSAPQLPTAPGPGETCAAEAHAAERAGVDLLFLVDVSTSMAQTVAGGTRSKWDMAQDAVSAFMRDPGSTGLNVGLQFFPAIAQCSGDICVGPGFPPGPTPPCPCPAGLTCTHIDPAMPQNCAGSPTSCDVADYRKLAVDFGVLPAAGPTLMTAFGIRNPSTATTSGTPTGPAIMGALDRLRAYLTATPGHRGALVVVTDGEPTFCQPTTADAIAAPVALARQVNPSISTFVIGVFTPADITRAGNVVAQLAAAGGTAPFVITPTDDLTRRLQDAFNEIRTLTVPCELNIPQPRSGTLDYAKVNVHLTSANREEDIPYVQSAARCHPTRGGWYYDADPATGAKPTRVVVCEASCKALSGDATAKVDLRFGCRTLVVD